MKNEVIHKWHEVYVCDQHQRIDTTRARKEEYMDNAFDIDIGFETSDIIVNGFAFRAQSLQFGFKEKR